MFESLFRIRAIARNTLTEALRQKVLNILLLFGVIAIVSGFLFANFTLAEQFKFLKDFSIGAMSVFGLLIALMGTAQLLPNEIENRTIYTILAKPVRRSEFLIGKYCGMLALLATTMLLMSIVFVGVILTKERLMINAELRDAQGANAEMQAMANENIKQIHKEARDPRLIQAIVLTYAKLAVVAGLALLISTFATSAIFTVATTFMVYIIGHLESVARAAWLTGGSEVNFAAKIFLGVLSFLVPDMNIYNVIDEIIAGSAVPWSHTLNVLSYTGIFLLILMSVAILIFNEREL